MVASSIQATVACSVHRAGPSVHTASTVTTRTGRLGWLKKITRLFVGGKNLEISIKGYNLPEAGFKNGCRKDKTALVCFCDFARGTCGEVEGE